MSPGALTLQVFDAALGLVIVWSSLDHLRRMNRKTHWKVRWAFITLAIGGFLLFIGPFFGYPATSEERVIVHVGIVLFLLTDRRRPSDCPEIDDCDRQRRHPLTDRPQ